MTEHYVVDSGSRLKAWDVNAYTQAIVTATKEGKIIDVDSAVKIGNEWEVRYTLGESKAVAEPVTPPEPEVTPAATATTPEPTPPEVVVAQDVEDQAPPPAEPKPKATRKRRAPRTS